MRNQQINYLYFFIIHYITSTFIIVLTESSDKSLPILEPVPQLCPSISVIGAVELALEPENVRGIDTRQRIVAVLIVVENR